MLIVLYLVLIGGGILAYTQKAHILAWILKESGANDRFKELEGYQKNFTKEADKDLARVSRMKVNVLNQTVLKPKSPQVLQAVVEQQNLMILTDRKDVVIFTIGRSGRPRWWNY